MFHPNAPSYHNSSLPSIYRRHELQKKREYGKRVQEVEQASFIPLVFSTTDGMGREALTFYRCLADMLSCHSSTSYSGILAWIRCTLSFSLLHSATMCIQGTRSILPTMLIIIIIINLPKKEGIHKRQSLYKVSAYKSKHTYTYSTLQTKQYTTKHKTVIKKLLDT